MKLRTCFFLFFALLLFHMTTEVTVPLRTCAWIGNSSTSIFTGCIVSNFSKIKQASGLTLNACFNPGDSFYIGCIQKNFKTIARELP